MQYRSVCIESMGYVLPPNVIESTHLEAQIEGTMRRLGLPPGQLEKLSGVQQRRWWDPGTQPSTVAAMAAERALANAGVPREAVGVLINTSVSRDYLEPATAAMVAGHMNMPRELFCFDVTNACLGFLNGLITAANLIELGQADYVLVVNGECTRDGVMATLKRMAGPDATSDTFRDNFATMTLGDGAVAALLCHQRVAKAGHRIRGAAVRTATEHNTLCLGNHTEMRSDPHGLLTHGVGLAVETWPYAVEELGWTPDQIDKFVCHQVSLSHFTHTFKQLELPLEKALLTFPYLGNVGPASLPLTLALGEAQGQILPGQELCMFAVGSGLGCIIMGVSW